MELEKRIETWLKDTSKELDISYLGLTEWPDILKGKERLIIQLDCSCNKLTSLPYLPNLTELLCGHNELTSLPSFPTLTTLSCHSNKLTSLPSFPNLTHLYCGYNNLTSLPSFPNLTTLYCYNNKLTSLPFLPKLTKLYCEHNKLTFLPCFSNLIEFGCEANNLFSDELSDWKTFWPLYQSYHSQLLSRGLTRVLKVLKNRLYLPRLKIEDELIYSPNHPGKFYLSLRVGDWSQSKLKNQV